MIPWREEHFWKKDVSSLCRQCASKIETIQNLLFKFLKSTINSSEFKIATEKLGFQEDMKLLLEVDLHIQEKR